MPTYLPVPPELQHLIEKRETDDRRTDENRSGDERREVDLGPLGAIESGEDLEQLPLVERRSGEERRATTERRKQARRAADQDEAGC
jgi:hypothetical protein